MKLATPPVVACDCEQKIRKFMHTVLYKVRQPFPPEGSIIECDCGDFYRMTQGEWIKGDWSAEFTGMPVAYSS